MTPTNMIECITPDVTPAEHDEAATAIAEGKRSGATGESGLAEYSTQDLYRELLRRMGEDPERDGLVRTPERVERSTAFLTRGYGLTVEEVLHGALFDVDYDEMVIVKDVEFYSQCEHHILPFFGKAHIAYVPDGKVIGLSKLPRVVDVLRGGCRCRRG